MCTLQSVSWSLFSKMCLSNPLSVAVLGQRVSSQGSFPQVPVFDLECAGFPGSSLSQRKGILHPFRAMTGEIFGLLPEVFFVLF